jgi:cellulose synthase/poly-beta-1,6-N-acetylglucosamine synthase-like glycosyltransferase
VTTSLSIIIPTFNRPSLLPRAVASALAACPDDAEVIVVDDRSDTALAALENMANDPRLQIFTNEFEKGAGGARNFGATQATGDLLLFLDDDDLLAGAYPARVIQACDVGGASFGFSAVAVVTQDADGPQETAVLDRKALRPGLIEHDVPLEDKTAAFSAGFWITRAVFDGVGHIHPAQTVDEDTDLCCRLYGLNHKAWFDETPGCTVYRGYDVVEGSAPQLTLSTIGLVEARCYARTFEHNQAAFDLTSPDRWFMLRRALRMAARAGSDDVARSLLDGLQPISWRIRGRLFWIMKRLGAYRRKT